MINEKVKALASTADEFLKLRDGQHYNYVLYEAFIKMISKGP